MCTWIPRREDGQHTPEASLTPQALVDDPNEVGKGRGVEQPDEVSRQPQGHTGLRVLQICANSLTLTMQGTDGHHRCVLGVFISVPRNVAGTAGSTKACNTGNVAIVRRCTAVVRRGNEQKLKPVFPDWMPRASFQRTVMTKLLVIAGLRCRNTSNTLGNGAHPKLLIGMLWCLWVPAVCRTIATMHFAMTAWV